MADYNSSYTGAEIDEGVGNGLAAPTTYAPIDHAASASTYGAGTGTKYGHLMLSDSTSSTSSTSGGVAATPAAVKAAYDLADGKQDPLTFDNVPTENSANPVKSGGVYSALADKADQSALNTFVRPNLLDNWYFVGGGSQQGGGQFPINTRGQTSYSGSGNGIDKWKGGTLSNTTVEITSSGIRQTVTGSYSGNPRLLYQTLDNPQTYIGKTVTVSCLLSGLNVTQGQLVLGLRYATSGGDYIGARDINVNSTGLISGALTIPNNSNIGELAFRFSGNLAVNDYFVVNAVKLELGPTQTLAHQENGTWVLNEIPDYNEQMLRCNEGLGQYAQVEYGSYTGTGTYGSENANSLTFPFVPKFLLVKQESSSSYSIVAANGLTSVYSDYSTSYSNTMTWSDKTVEWYSTNAARQLNTASTVYHYVAFG